MDKAGQRTEDSNFEVRVVRQSRLTFKKEEECETPRSVVPSQLIDTATVTFFAGTPNGGGSTPLLALAVLSPLRQGVTAVGG